MAAPVATATEKRKLSKPLIIVIILILLALTVVFGYLVLKGNVNITKLFNKNKNKEHTILLNEFVVNLKSDNNKKSYLKMQIALMYENKKDGVIIESNVNKIRDIIINNLLGKTSTDIIDEDNIHNFKEKLKKDINLALNDDLIKDIYITDLVIQ